MSVVRAELRKLLGLPTAWAGLVLGILLAPLVTLLNAGSVRRLIAAGADTSDVGLQDLGVGLIGPMVLGVVVVSSEFTSTGDDAPGARQLTATLVATPRRMRLLAAKVVALVLVAGLQAAVTATATLTLSRLLHGLPAPAAGRVAGALAYWMLTALLAFTITLIVRNGIVPLAVLIVNSTVVSVSYLLTKLTPVAAYLPDIAGTQMFLRTGDFPVKIAPPIAGLVMTAWTAAFLTLAAALFLRRDA